jgi:hypothetical protein
LRQPGELDPPKQVVEVDLNPAAVSSPPEHLEWPRRQFAYQDPWRCGVLLSAGTAQRPTLGGPVVVVGLGELRRVSRGPAQHQRLGVRDGLA